LNKEEENAKGRGRSREHGRRALAFEERPLSSAAVLARPP
jgi:hypothetical protein